MPGPNPFEDKALEQAGNLLLFAAENRKDLSSTIISNISESWRAKADNQWTAQTSEKFWTAYHSLCNAIKPVSIVSINCTLDNIPRPRWMFWRNRNEMISISKRTAQNYLWLLLTLLIITIALQFVVTTVGASLKEIDTALTDADESVERIRIDESYIKDIVGAKPFNDPQIPVTAAKTISDIDSTFDKINFSTSKLLAKEDMNTRLITFGLLHVSVENADYSASTDIAEVTKNISDYYDLRTHFSMFGERVSIVIKILNFALLPLILGMLGACAYVTRLISDEIRDTTFSNTSRQRHFVRVGLGALAGVVVGSGWIGSDLSWSPLALAFVAGYAIEPVFATIDTIAEKFKKT